MQQPGANNPPLPRQPERGSILSRLIHVASFRATLWVWLSFALLLLTFLFHIIAFSIVKWGHISEPQAIDVGLWQECFVEAKICSYFSVSELTDAYRCTQAFATLSFLLIFSSFLLTIVYIFYQELQTDGLTHVLLIAVRAVTVLFLIITFSVWSAHWLDFHPESMKVEGALGPAFALEIVCFVFELAATGLLVVDYLLNIRRKSSSA